MTVKIAPLLAHYLYANKRLDLPNIGTFTLDNPVAVEPESNKQSKNIPLEGVSFESNTSIKEPTADLVQFIATNSGRIKPLAAADLESHLGLALQFINIGKPYYIEGIGSLTKINSGGFTFIPGVLLNEKLSDYVAKEAGNSASRAADDNYKPNFSSPMPTTNWKKPVLTLLIIAGIGLAVWGGYMVYKKTNAKKDVAEKTETPVENKTELIPPIADTAATLKDSAIQQPVTPTITPVVKIPGGKNKYVLEVSDRVRATQRYNKLKTYLWDVQLETKDSVSYKLFMLLPGDTTIVKDSLTMLNGKKVYIDKY